MIPDCGIRFFLEISNVGQDEHAQAGSTEQHDHSVDLLDERGLWFGVDNLKNKKGWVIVTTYYITQGKKYQSKLLYDCKL